MTEEANKATSKKSRKNSFILSPPGAFGALFELLKLLT